MKPNGKAQGVASFTTDDLIKCARALGRKVALRTAGVDIEDAEQEATLALLEEMALRPGLRTWTARGRCVGLRAMTYKTLLRRLHRNAPTRNRLIYNAETM